MTAELHLTTPQSILTLSALGERGPQRPGTTPADRTTTDPQNAALRGSDAVTGHIAAELRRIDTAKRRGAHRTARAHLDRLIDFVWFSEPDAS